MDSVEENSPKCIHILLKGESGDDNSEYLKEFQFRQQLATSVPILSFNYVNQDELLLAGQICDGLIVTSPRSVYALQRAGFFMREIDVDKNLVFVVGEKTGKECLRLGLDYNRGSVDCGNAKSLAQYVKAYVGSRSNLGIEISLLYPKSSLADNTIENELSQVSSLTIKSIICYETSTVDNIADLSLNNITSLSDLSKFERLIINLIFFSPSGLDGFLRIGEKSFIEFIEAKLNTRLRLKYSCIGRTTASAMERKGLAVFSVAEKPTPDSLAESIFNAMQNMKYDDSG